MPDHPLHLTVAITGASGAIFGQILLQTLDADARVERVNFVPSENSLRVLAEEMNISGRNGLAEKLLGRSSDKVRQLSDSDIGACVASGSSSSRSPVSIWCRIPIANSVCSSTV